MIAHNTIGTEPSRLPEADLDPHGADPPSRPTALVHLRRWVARRALRGLLGLYSLSMAIARMIGPPKRRVREAEGCEILLTGTFYSDNWISSHLRPLAAAEQCARVCVVSIYPIPPTPKVVAIYPAPWLRRLIGGVPARMLTFAWTAIRRRPHYVGGFHLLLNGMWAALIARIVGARSLYFCVGGPAEVLDGGLRAENRLFGKLEVPDPVIERRLVKIVNSIDLVVTMGTRAVDFFRSRGVESEFHVVSGGIDDSRFVPAEKEPTIDLILVGRLAEIKRIDVFLRAVEIVRERVPGVQATIVGDGEQRAPLESLARELRIDECVHFAGQQTDVASWLRRSRIFVLSSDSEGLALSLMEAMMCGLPGVVSNVGDLGDLVRDGENGFLVPRRDPRALAEAIVRLLTDADRLDRFSQAARRDALVHAPANVSRKWDSILGAANPALPGFRERARPPETASVGVGD